MKRKSMIPLGASVRRRIRSIAVSPFTGVGIRFANASVLPSGSVTVNTGVERT